MLGQEKPLRLKEEIKCILKRVKLHKEFKKICNYSVNMNEEADLIEAKKILDNMLPAIRKLLKCDDERRVFVITNLAAILLEEYSYLQMLANILCSPKLRAMNSFVFLFLSAYRHLMAVKEAENSLMFFLRSKTATDEFISTFETSICLPTEHITWLYESEFELLDKELSLAKISCEIGGAKLSIPNNDLISVLMSHFNLSLLNQLKVYNVSRLCQ